MTHRLRTAGWIAITGLLFGCADPATEDASPAAAATEEARPAAQAHTRSVSAYEQQMAADQRAHPTLEIGAPLPDFSLMGIDDVVHTPEDYADSPVLAVVFISNHCPASQLYESRIKGIVEDYADRGVQLITIAPNGTEAAAPRELNYTDVDDSFEAMKIRAEYRNFTFPYLYDGETQAISHQFGPKVTPHIFIFDEDRRLRYEGRIDNHMRAEKVTVRDASNAIDALLTGQPIPVPHTPVFGCSTKWNSHAPAAKTEMEEWRALPVELESVSMEGLTELRANPTGKTLMVNFWATWCAPCQREYPALLETYLWYRSRDFEFVSVSVDTPEVEAAVKEFLENVDSGIRNLQVDTDDVYGVMAAFDPSWDSGIPFTMVIAPDGEIIFSHAGEVDILELRRTILGHLPDAGLFAGNTEYWREI